METNAPNKPTPGCPICGERNARGLFDVPSPYLPSASYQILHCQMCGHRFANGPVTASVLAQVYGDAFHGTTQQRAEHAKSAVVQNAEQRANWLYGLIGAGKLLDVGAGRGYFVKSATKYFAAEGIDFSSSAQEYGRELRVKIESGDFLLAPYENNSFNVVTFWDVLASMMDVQQTIGRAQGILVHGGHLVITVPLADSVACRVAGRRWPLWIPPVNLHYFSKNSVRTLLESHGFVLVKMTCFSKRVSLNFLLLKLARSFGMNSVAKSLAHLPVTWAVPINLGDILTVVARKG